MRRWRLSLLIALIASATRCGPGDVCTQIGCVPTLEISVLAPDLRAELVDGAYEFEASIYGEGDRSLRFSILDGEVMDEQPHEQAVAVENGVLVLRVAGAALIEPMEVIEMTLTRDGTLVRAWAAEATWDEPHHPNGEGCDGWGCANGVVEVWL